MNEVYDFNICRCADKPLADFIGTLDVETAHHRVEGQSVKCGFGLQGLCCRLCSNGPCRITPEGERGICGATADTIVARNFLRAVSAGSGCYIHVVENTALNLRNTGLKKGLIKGKNALEALCKAFGITAAKDDHEKCVLVADAVLKDIHRPEYEKMELVEKLGYEPRVKRWKELGIMPGGAKAEVFNGVVKSSTNLNSDPINMYLHCLRLGISTGLYGLTLTNLLNDVMLGEPEIMAAPVGLHVIDKDYINIMITGHQHSMIAYLQDALISDSAKKKAQAAGAKGFKIVGCTCVGQDLQLRGCHYKEVFSGHAGNNFTSEAVLATGGIDGILSEFNCTLPGIEPICEKLQITQICLDDVAKKANAEYIPFKFEEREKTAEIIIDKFVDAYKKRRPKVKINVPNHGNADTITGVSEGSLTKFLGGSVKPLLDLILNGSIKGVAGIVGCSNMTALGHDVFTVELAKELIARDIIVLSAGCSTGGLENCGLMSPSAAKLAGPKLRAVCEKLGIPPALNFGPCLSIGRLELVAVELAKLAGLDLPQLPVVLSAPQWLEEQALADGCFGLALGFPLHLGLPPFVTGSPLAVQTFTETMKTLTGGELIIDLDVKSSADKLEASIMAKRKALNI